MSLDAEKKKPKMHLTSMWKDSCQMGENVLEWLRNGDYELVFVNKNDKAAMTPMFPIKKMEN